MITLSKSSLKFSSIFIKVIRTLVFCALFCGLTYYIYGCYEKLKIVPEVLVNERNINRNEVPFPAITICPPQIIGSKFLNFTKLNEKIEQNKTLSSDEKMILVSTSQICRSDKTFLDKISKIDNFSEDIIQTLDKISPQINETFTSCLTSVSNKCEKIFLRTLTFRGYCFTFNMLDHSSIFLKEISSDFDSYKYKDKPEDNLLKWTLENGYVTKEENVKPLKTTEVVYLSLITGHSKKDIANFCKDRFESYEILFHLPNEMPLHMHLSSFLESKRHHFLSIKAAVKRVDKSLRIFPPIQRKCYFEDERQLRYFKMYTINNCIQECMSNFTHLHCNNSLLAAPRTNEMKVYKYYDNLCADNIYNSWPLKYYEDSQNVENFPDFPCNCMPACKEIKYDFESDYVFNKESYGT